MFLSVLVDRKAFDGGVLENSGMNVFKILNLSSSDFGSKKFLGSGEILPFSASFNLKQ